MGKTKLDAETKVHIEKLLAIFGGAVLLAVAVSVGLVSFYHRDGAYTASHILLEPRMLEGLSYTAAHPTTGRQTRFLFAGVEFVYYDSAKERWVEKNIDIPTYTKFFNMIAKERSVLENVGAVQQTFGTHRQARLSLRVATYSYASERPPIIPFQHVLFAENGDYYAIELRDDRLKTHWAYFYHPNIYQKVLALFNP